jgi:hypothetical protein
MTVARQVLSTLVLAGASFVACQVYDPSLLTGGAGAAGRGTAGSGATGGTAVPSGGSTGVGGAATSGGTGGGAVGATGGGGMMAFEAGAGGEGEQPAGGTAGVGGGLGGTGGAAGNGGATGGVAGKGGGAAGAGGKGGSAGTAGAGGASGTAGSSATGGAGTGPGGAGAGGAGAGGTAGGGSGGVPTVELTGVATASTSENGGASNKQHPAAHGNDEDLMTRWCASGPSAGQYWTVDLMAVHEVVRFEVTWEYPSQAVGLPYRYRIDTSTDGTTFTPSIDKTTNMEVTSTQSVNFPPGTLARHVRIVITGLPNGQTWASFFEASVYGI